MIAIAWFELRTRLRRLSTYIYFLCMFVLSLLAVSAAAGALKNAQVTFSDGRVLANSPYSLNAVITLLSHFGLLITSAVMGRAVQQDFESKTEPFFFTAPITKLQYLGGRFLGALATVLIIFSALGLGAAVATRMPWVEATRLGPNHASSFIMPYVTGVIPNLLFTGAIFFSMASLLRTILPVYVASVVLLIGYLMGNSLFRDLQNRATAALLDPFGLGAARYVTEYWTVADRNQRLLKLQGMLLYNRLLWMGVAALLLVYTYWRFSFSARAGGASARSSESEEPVEPARVDAPKVAPSFSFGGNLGAMWRLGLMYARQTMKSIYFVVIAVAGVLAMMVGISQSQKIFGTRIYPVTWSVLETAANMFALFVLIIIAFYSGELVWRERDARMDQIFDALPVPSWVVYGAKLWALMLLQVVLALVVMATGMAYQVLHGYFRLEPGQYVKELLGIRLIGYWLLCVLGLTLHVLVNNKYVGHFAMVLFYLSSLSLGWFGLEHHLYNYGSTPDYVYSDMNRYGPFIAGIVWFNIYWVALAAILAIVSAHLWPRGQVERLAVRIRRARWGRAARVALAAFGLVLVGSGAFIYYNTNILNRYQTSWQREEESARYERELKPAFKDRPQPRITEVKLDVDLHPEQRGADLRGTYVLVNKSGKPVDQILINLPYEADIRRLDLGRPAHRIRAERALGAYVYQLETPLAAGERTTLAFDLGYWPRGFPNGAPNTKIVENGTFFDNSYAPAIGYQPTRELDEDDTRRKHKLQPRPRMADLEDRAARRNNYVSSDADWMSFEATVSTSPDQIAIAPGYLQREWMENGRRHFAYKMDSPILNLYGFLSARYAVRRDRWNDVAIEVLYQPGHEYNLDRMIRGVKDSLAYFTAHFSPYQHRQVRIIEFPRYQTFAQSLPNTIPYSEGIGFIARVDDRDEDDVDYPYYVTAHEVGHQWWAHQVIGGNVQGCTLMSESLAQYSALMVMKQSFGETRMRRFLKYELDRYLRGRGGEHNQELPLERVEASQQYIYYGKGSVVTFALQEYLGEDVMNRALAGYIKKVAFQEPPYTYSPELEAALREVTPEKYLGLLSDSLQEITLYNNRALSATSRAQPDGWYEVELTAEARKMRADGQGNEVPQPLHDYVELGVFDDQKKPLYLEKVLIDHERVQRTVRVHGKPARAGIDPRNLLVDRKPDDNTVPVS